MAITLWMRLNYQYSSIIQESMNYTLSLCFALCLASILSHNVSAQERKLGWVTNGSIGANFTQVGLQNWAGGGQNTIGITGLFTYQANWTGENSDWKNGVDLGYGLTKLGEQEFRKSDDRFFVRSQYDYKASDVLSYTGLLDFRTQFTAGYNYVKRANGEDSAVTISNIFAPANLLVGLGATYTPVDYFKVTVAPLGNVVIICTEQSLRGKYGVDSSSAFKSLLCATLDMQFKKEIMTNVTLQSGLNVIAPYAEFARQIVNWNTLLTLKVNDYINASFALDVIYNDRTTIKNRNRENGNDGPATQIRNVIGIGFGYKF